MSECLLDVWAPGVTGTLRRAVSGECSGQETDFRGGSGAMELIDNSLEKFDWEGEGRGTWGWEEATEVFLIFTEREGLKSRI